MRGALGSAESQEWRRRQLGHEPHPNRDLAAYLRGEYQEGRPFQINGREPDAVGRQVTDRMVSRLEVDHALRQLPYRQRRVIDLLYVQGLSRDQVLEQLHISERTLERDRSEALRAMVRIIYEW